eukprot:Skav228375  [mRNA]  locus=scaffold1981:271189:277732:+ [translate_table: standard]
MPMSWNEEDPSEFQELLKELSRVHEYELKLMREEIQKLRAGSPSRFRDVYGPSTGSHGIHLLPKAFQPRLEPSERIPDFDVEIEIPPPLSEANDVEDDARSSSRKDTTELAKEAAKAMMFGQSRVSRTGSNQSDEEPSRMPSHYRYFTQTRNAGPAPSRLEISAQESDKKSHLDLSLELPEDATFAKYLVSDRGAAVIATNREHSRALLGCWMPRV